MSRHKGTVRFVVLDDVVIVDVVGIVVVAVVVVGRVLVIEVVEVIDEVSLGGASVTLTHVSQRNGQRRCMDDAIAGLVQSEAIKSSHNSSS